MRSPSRAEPAEKGGPAPNESGSITAEFAAIVPAVVLVLACCLGGLHLGGVQLRLQDAVAVTARSLARGDAADIRALVSGATARTEHRGDLVCVIGTVSTSLAGGVLGAIETTATSCALGDGR